MGIRNIEMKTELLQVNGRKVKETVKSVKEGDNYVSLFKDKKSIAAGTYLIKLMFKDIGQEKIFKLKI